MIRTPRTPTPPNVEPRPDGIAAIKPDGIAAVVLAAGGSTRMGRPKQLLPYDGQPLVSRAVGAALEAGAAPVIVVLGAHASDIGAALAHLAGITVVINPAWETGLASSLTAGLHEALSTQCDGVLVTLGDQPHVDAAVLGQLIARFRKGARIVAAGYGEVPGVPALFGREHVASLLGLTGDTGAGPWLRARPQEVVVVPFFDRVLLDLDAPSDLESLAARQGLR